MAYGNQCGCWPPNDWGVTDFTVQMEIRIEFYASILDYGLLLNLLKKLYIQVCWPIIWTLNYDYLKLLRNYPNKQ